MEERRALYFSTSNNVFFLLFEQGTSHFHFFEPCKLCSWPKGQVSQGLGQNWHSITFSIFYWSKQVTRPAQSQRGRRRKRDSKSWMGSSLPYRDGRNCWWLSLRIIYSNHWSWLVWSSGFSSEKIELILLTYHGCLRMKEYYSCNSWSMAMAHSELVPSLL